jgi:predicted nucleic acid-binding Zn ribbon protein
MGRIKDRTKGFRGAYSTQLRQSALAEKTGSGGYAAPPEEAMRRFIEAGICPWCEAGPFRVLALHVSQKHGIDRFQLRDLAGLTYSASICDPQLSADIAARMRAPENLERLHRGRTNGPRRISEVAKKQNYEKLRRWNEEVGPDEVRRNQIEGNRIATENRVKWSTCPICGGTVRGTKRETCSDECALKILQRNAERGRAARWARP